MAKTNSDIIYVEMIDGTSVHIPVSAKQVAEMQYQLLGCSEFNPDDKTILLEFIPGDTVIVEPKKFKNGEIGLVAKFLVIASDHFSKKMHEFRFKAVKGLLKIDAETKFSYKNEIAEIKKEIGKGSFVYPEICSTIKCFENLEE